MITADTITDEQIRELRKVAAKERSDPDHPNFDRSHGLFGAGPVIPACWDALNGRLHPRTRLAARARCAEILNARGRSVAPQAIPPGHSIADHKIAVLDDAKWNAMEYVGIQHVPAGAHEDEPAYDSELRDCSCGSTLSRPVAKEIT